MAKEKKVKQKQARAALERKAKREREADPQLADEKREEDTAKRVNELKDKMAARDWLSKALEIEVVSVDDEEAAAEARKLLSSL